MNPEGILPKSPRPDRDALAFGDFRLDPGQRIVERDGQVLRLTPKVVDTLLVLLENAGQVVEKKRLLQQVWPDTFVVESSLTRNISILRKALGCQGQYIETVAKRGYRFVAPVRRVSSEPVVARGAPGRAWRFAWGAAALAAVAAALTAGLYLASSAPTAASPIDGSPEARRLTLIGSWHWHKLSASDLRKAEAHFRNAVAIDPRSASSWSGLADARMSMASMGMVPVRDGLAKAEKAARRALSLNPGLAPPHAAFAQALLFTRFDWAAAEAEYRESLRLDPTFIRAYAGYACLLTASRRFAEAGELLRKAQEIDPASPLLGLLQGRLHYSARRFDRAIETLEAVLDRDSGLDIARYYLALSYAYRNRFDEALRELRLSKRHPGLQETDEAWILARAGNPKPALALLERRRISVARGEQSPIVIPLLAAALGFREEALAALDASLKERRIELLALGADPRLREPLVAEPAYRALLSRVRPGHSLDRPRTAQ